MTDVAVDLARLLGAMIGTGILVGLVLAVIRSH